jgi:carbon monoxide dehydrogenase subunit G
MDIRIDKRFDLEASVEQAWSVLADMHAVAACMPGATITGQVDASNYNGTVKSKVGPATMNFNGTIELLGLDAGAKTMELLAKGADRAGSSASMKLAARIEAGGSGTSAAQSVLVGQATVSVSGKIAQFGNRLLMPVSDALLEQFAANFRAAAAAAAVAASAATAPAGAASPRAETAPAPQRELNALALLWAALKGWFGGLFGRRG